MVVDRVPTLSMSLFLKLRAFNSFWNCRIAKFIKDNWRLEVNEALILIIGENDPLTSQADIGVHLNIHPNVMVALVKGLRKRSLIEIKQHPHDGRKQVITLTPVGLETVREIRARNSEMLSRSLPMEAEDRRRLEEIVTLVINTERSIKEEP